MSTDTSHDKDPKKARNHRAAHERGAKIRGGAAAAERDT